MWEGPQRRDLPSSNWTLNVERWTLSVCFAYLPRSLAPFLSSSLEERIKGEESDFYANNKQPRITRITRIRTLKPES
jgi:hypothetical protein